MVKIDMEMPKSCFDCPFCDQEQSGCIASGKPGFVVFSWLANTEFAWEEWKEKTRSGRDPRCPLTEDGVEKMRCANCAHRRSDGYCEYKQHDTYPDQLCEDWRHCDDGC